MAYFSIHTFFINVSALEYHWSKKSSNLNMTSAHKLQPTVIYRPCHQEAYMASCPLARACRMGKKEVQKIISILTSLGLKTLFVESSMSVLNNPLLCTVPKTYFSREYSFRMPVSRNPFFPFLGNSSSRQWEKKIHVWRVLRNIQDFYFKFESKKSFVCTNQQKVHLSIYLWLANQSKRPI